MPLIAGCALGVAPIGIWIGNSVYRHAHPSAEPRPCPPASSDDYPPPDCTGLTEQERLARIASNAARFKKRIDVRNERIRRCVSLGGVPTLGFEGDESLGFTCVAAASVIAIDGKTW